MQTDPSTYQIFRQVFHQYYKPLCQYAFTIVKEPHACEDIVQDIFTKMWEKKQAILAKPEVRFYLFTAVHNNCLSFLKKNKRWAITELTGQEGREIADEILNYNHRSPEEITALINEALERLPPKCRQVFVLSRMSKLTYQQIADASGTSVKTVENQMGKALSIMRSFVKERNVYILCLMVLLVLMQ